MTDRIDQVQDIVHDAAQILSAPVNDLAGLESALTAVLDTRDSLLGFLVEHPTHQRLSNLIKDHWHSVVYQGISMLKSFSKSTLRSSTVDDKTTGKQRFIKIATDYFSGFVLFYQSLLQKWASSSHLSVLQAIVERLPPNDAPAKRSIDHKPTTIDDSVMLANTYNILISLGDLSRHEQNIIVSSVKEMSWTAARRYYETALCLFPDQGNAYQQLGIIYRYENALLDAQIYFMLSVTRKDEFTTGLANVALGLEKLNSALASSKTLSKWVTSFVSTLVSILNTDGDAPVSGLEQIMTEYLKRLEKGVWPCHHAVHYLMLYSLSKVAFPLYWPINLTLIGARIGAQFGTPFLPSELI